MINVFNTMTLQKEPFSPIEPMKVSMYVCGPTVYNYIHIGNARSAIAFDTIRRYFIYRGYEVRYVSNFTDVDDKMIKAAKEQGISVPELADRYINAYEEDTKALNILPATVRPRATENITEIIEFVEALVAKNYAYAVDGDVYFRAKKYQDYGILAHQDLNEMEHNAAGRLDDEEMERKEDPMDFAVWKGAQNDGAIAWESPWGLGRPGWHIECSVMSTKYLGNHFDLHGGGIDLAFPHHTNEIAQAEAKTGEKFVNQWLHNGFVTVGDEHEKMSKSMGNFTTVHELLAELDDPMILRFMMATTQYRRPIAYSQKNLELATRNLQRIKTAYQNLAFRLNSSQTGADMLIEQKVNAIIERFVLAMDDDFNAQNGLAAIFDLAELANVYGTEPEVKAQTIEFILKSISDLMMVFGVDNLAKNDQLDQAVDELINARELARQNKDYVRADQIRNELTQQGIILEDTPQGIRWHRR
ncbi:cysteine--tRNA ligase [Weissella coleopterorum]|uniref:Cysteine--tRNA ligase n=1 Tax=Weissella coleopterorum TaxID=2714949 RepID=A0A6G8AYJ9_9LACO|nr:cysteine--tRNA ligase [Weissella coleopterorum]QIL50138.1 cysteine--tRNA ligase [Weissella coleopterorum]